MRIAIDARELTGRPTGVGRYLSELLMAWADLPGASAHEFVLCAPETVRAPDALRASAATAPGHGTLWEQRALPRLVRDARADVLFCPGYTGPLLPGAPMVVVIHDVSFAAHPEWFSAREGLRRRWLTRLTAHRAARILTISEFSKREIVRCLRVPAEQVDVTYLGISHIGPPEGGPHETGGPHESSLPVGAAFRRPETELMVLFVGSLFNRRHLPELIAGFERLSRRHPEARLEIVGDNRTRPFIDITGVIARTAAADRIRARSWVPDEELAGLYASASAFAFLSAYEGFALTPLEALGAGVPPVLLDTEVAREIYGPAALYVDRPEPERIAAALEQALFNGAERERVLAAGAVQLGRYNWRDCAHRTLQVLTACSRS